MKILLVTFSDNADHQDTLFGLYEHIKDKYDTFLLAIKDPKVELEVSDHMAGRLPEKTGSYEKDL